MKGITEIELTNVKTGERERYIEENMITNAIPDLMRAIPMYYRPSDIEMNFIPLWEKAMGGVILFDNTLNENADLYYEPYGVNKVGYASAGASNLTDPKRGSKNTIESEHLSNGVKLVWDFTTAQANGTIQSICLTSSKGGEGEYGSFDGKMTSHVRFITRDLTESNTNNSMRCPYRMVSIEADEKNKIPQMYSIQQKASSIVIRKHSIPMGYLSQTNKSIIYADFDESETITLPFTNQNGLQEDALIFIDGFDGYWYGFYASANKSGSGSIYVVKISKADYTFTDLGYQTLSGCTLATISGNGYYYVPVVSNGFAYLSKCNVSLSSSTYNYYGTEVVYKVKLSDFSDITEISTGPTFSKETYYIGTCKLPNGSVIYGDRMIHPDDTCIVVQASTSNPAWFYNSYYFKHPVIYYKTFMFLIAINPNSNYCMISINPYYLATINNLSTPITKTADKTMKITYTLTYE